MPPSRATASKILRSPASIDVTRIWPQAGQLAEEYLTAEYADCKHSQAEARFPIYAGDNEGVLEPPDIIIDPAGWCGTA
jgi:hypothetical protein